MKLTDRQENNILDDNDLFHGVDVSDLSQASSGSSFKIKLISFVNWLRQKTITLTGVITFSSAPKLNSVGATKYLKTDASNDIIGLNNIPYVDVSGAPLALPPNGVAGGDLTGSYPNPTVNSNKITNAKMAQGAANTVKCNPTGGAANVQDVAISANSVLGRVAGLNSGNITAISFQDVLESETLLVAGTVTVFDARITVNSFCSSIALSNIGSITNVPIRCTITIAGQATFATGVGTDTARFGFRIVII